MLVAELAAKRERLKSRAQLRKHRLKQSRHLFEFKSECDELNAWIGQYVADMDDPAPGVRSRRPLRKARRANVRMAAAPPTANRSARSPALAGAAAAGWGP